MRVLKIVFVCVFCFLPITTYSQAEWPDIPQCDSISIPNKISVDSLIKRSLSGLDTNTYRSLCYLQESSEKSNSRNTKTKIGLAARSISEKLYQTYNYKEAVYFESLSAQIWYDLDSIKQYCNSLIKLGENYYKLDDQYNSLKYLNQAKEVSEKYNFQDEKYQTFIALAWTYKQVSNFNESEKYILLSKSMIDNNTIIANYYEYYYLYSLLYRTKANYTIIEQYNDAPLEVKKKNSIRSLALAMKYNDSSIRVAKKIGDTRLLAKAISNKANFLIYSKGNIDTIIENITYAIKINHQMDDMQQLGSNYGVLSKAYLYSKNYLKAIETANKALEYAKKSGSSYSETVKYNLLTQGYKEIGDYKNAFFYSEKYHALYKEIYGFKDFNEIFEIQKKYDEKLNTNIIDNLKIKNKQNRRIYWLISIISLLLVSGVLLVFFRNKTNQKIKNEALSIKASNELLQMEMEALRARMNPHFLFNSLNSIKSFIIKNESRNASLYLSKFAALVRMILNHSKEKTISLHEELKAISYYIDIEKMRLKDKFEYHLLLDKAINLDEIEVPPSILQPFVENAIWHGFLGLTKKCKLSINVLQKDDNTLIEIIDNGIGREKSKNLKSGKHKSAGLKIIDKTIEAYRNKDILDLEITTIDLFDDNDKPSGTKICIAIKK